MDKFCMVIAGRDEAVKNACGTIDKLGFIGNTPEVGIHSFQGPRKAMPDIVVMDVGAFDQRALSQKLEALERDHHVTVFCATPADKADLEDALIKFPVNLAMKPFELCDGILN